MSKCFNFCSNLSFTLKGYFPIAMGIAHRTNGAGLDVTL